MSAAKKLADRACVPCVGGQVPLKGDALGRLARQLDGDWDVVGEHHLLRRFRFKDFAEALAFVNEVGALAEEQGHHPDIHLAWGKVVLTVYTHKIDGLSESDFVLAAKIEALR